MSVWSDQDAVCKHTIVTACGAEHGILHDYAVPANCYAPALGNKTRAVHDARTGGDGYVAAHRRVGSNPRVRMNLRPLSSMFNDHWPGSGQPRESIASLARVATPTVRRAPLQSPVCFAIA